METAKQITKRLLLVLIVLIFLYPILYMVICSFFSESELDQMLMNNDGQYMKPFPSAFAPSLEQYRKAAGESSEYWQGMLNSLIITIPTVLGHVVISALAAFSFAKLKLPFRNILFTLYIILLVLPLQVTLVPTYMVLDQLSILNHFPAVILPGVFSTFGTCLLRQNMKYVDDSIIEAAKIDGASYFIIFSRIIVPQMKGPLAALTMLCFIDTWNAVEQPLIYLDTKSMYPLSITLSDMGSTGYTNLFSYGILFMVPPLLVYLFVYKGQDVSALDVNKG